jgi:hypothetical protein
MIVESEASWAARQAAARFGDVEGSSYSTFEERPVLWAFDVAADAHRIIFAGGESSDRSVLLLVDEENAFTGMMHAKAIVGYSRERLGPHVVTVVDQVDPKASWFCDTFYLSRHRCGPASENELLAVALHGTEVGLDPDRAERSLLARSPKLISTPDPAAKEATFPSWVKLIRSLRRLVRFRELNAPEVIIDNEIEMAMRFWKQLGRRTLAAWPEDLIATAAMLER